MLTQKIYVLEKGEIVLSYSNLTEGKIVDGQFQGC